MKEVIKVIAEHLDVEQSKVTPEAHLVNDLGADAFDTVELVIQVEKATGVKISEDDGDKVQTVQDLINLVEKNNVDLQSKSSKGHRRRHSRR